MRSMTLTALAVRGLILAGLPSRVLSSPVSAEQLVFPPASPAEVKSSPRPLVIWHGLGDTALSDGISDLIEGIKDIHPGIFVHSVQVPKGGSLDDERRAGFWGKAEDQADAGCAQLAAIEELKGGFDGIGFSQGGLFMRYYAQYCNHPPVKNLLTFGTPNLGIAALIPCPTPPTVSCLLAARAARGGIYTTYAQDHLIQAQYFRDTERLDEFLEKNTFLRDLNAELKGEEFEFEEESQRNLASSSEEKIGRSDTAGDCMFEENGGYGLSGLENLVAIMFDADKTVSPAQSAHFASYSPQNKTVVVPLNDTSLYSEDWIGLRKLDERGALHLAHCPGEHMDLSSGDCIKNALEEWVGWERS